MKKNFFINLSNHPTDQWSDKQRAAALNIAEVLHNIEFPHINPSATAREIGQLAAKYFYLVLDLIGQDTGVVHIAGEPIFMMHFAGCCNLGGLQCVTATSTRKSFETTLPDGTTRKESVFEFVQFRLIESLYTKLPPRSLF